MSEDEQAVFLKLSVFRGGFEREAGQKVAGASLRTLTNLVNKSLLTRDPSGRYHVQKMLRQYAAERFTDSSEEQATRLAHCQYYAAFTSKFAVPFNSPKENAAVEALDVEQENIRLAWHHALTNGEYHMLDVMQETLHYYYLAHSWLRESYDLFKDMADAMQKAGHQDSTYWRARIRQTWAGTRFGKYEETLQIASEAIQFFGGDSRSTEVAHALNQISYVYMVQGDYEKAKEFARQSISGVERTDDIVAYYMGMGNLGYAHYLGSEYQQAREIYEQLNSSDVSENYSPSGIAYGKNNLGEILREMGQLGQAMDLFHEAYDIFKSTNRKRGMAFTTLNLGGAYFMQGEYAKAKENYESAYQLYREVGDQYGLAHALSNLGNAAMSIGQHEIATSKYEEALKIRRQLGDKRGIGDSLSDLARIHVNMKQLDKAEAFIDESLQIRIEIGDRTGLGLAHAGRGLAELVLGRFEEARADLEKAKVIGDDIGHLIIRGQSYAGLGQLACINGDFDEGLSYFKQVLGMTDFEHLPLPMVLFSLSGIAGIYIKQEKYEEAITLLTLVLRYPPNFIAMIEDRASDMLDQLRKNLGEAFVQTTLEQSKSLVLKNVVADLLAQK
ncbi:MAG: tetratricopeptide repeat protein [Anaerolineae bacterium]|nr:tetratricopeptide repeat protein [Anaerolineae bacterium]